MGLGSAWALRGDRLVIRAGFLVEERANLLEHLSGRWLQTLANGSTFEADIEALLEYVVSL